MIRQATSSIFANEPNRSDSQLAEYRAAVAPAAVTESAEQEISRLTWSVLDGKATHGERRRLAELVSVQHENRNSR